jgi:hypothetical protein
MFEIIESITPVLKLVEDKYGEDHNVRNAVIDSLISILKNHKVKQPSNTPEAK